LIGQRKEVRRGFGAIRSDNTARSVGAIPFANDTGAADWIDKRSALTIAEAEATFGVARGRDFSVMQEAMVDSTEDEAVAQRILAAARLWHQGMHLHGAAPSAARHAAAAIVIQHFAAMDGGG
jgi:hypothetical protein